MKENDLIAGFSSAITENWECPGLSDYNGNTYLYKEIAIKIAKLHCLFKELGVEPGDKVSLIGKNSAHWSIAFLGIVTYGAIAVPILPDFVPSDVEHIIQHSDSKVLIGSNAIVDTLDLETGNGLVAVVELSGFTLSNKGAVQFTSLDINALYHAQNPNGIIKEHLKYFKPMPNSLVMISYTSGTTGNSKGVMLPYKSLFANILFAQRNMPLKRGDNIVSFLPLAHSYGLAFEFLFPFSLGCHITFLTKTPSPQIILKAFGEIKPRLILSVPLVIEKIYKKKILPVIEKPMVKYLLKLPLFNIFIYRKIKKGLSQAFGDNFHEIIVGGAPFNAEVEKFFRKIRFPYTIGYGMTECGPLMYAPWELHGGVKVIREQFHVIFS